MRIILACCLFLITSVAGNTHTQGTQPTLVYIFDPLCGWCYSFDIVMEQIHQKYKGKLDFVVIPGGMVTGKRVKPISEVSEDILESIPHLEKTTGAKFGSAYLKMLEEGTELSDSERPSWAMNAFKSLDVEDEFTYAYLLQKALFWEGNSLNQDSTYVKLATKFGIEGNKFLSVMYSDSIKAMTNLGFKQVEETGIHGFPAVLMRKGKEVVLIAEGYEKWEKLDKKIEKFLRSEK